MKIMICLIILYCASASSFESKIEQLHTKLLFESENIGKFKFLKQQIQKIKIYEKICFEELQQFKFPTSCFKYNEYLSQIGIQPSSDLMEKVQHTCKAKASNIQNRRILAKYLATYEITSESCKRTLKEQFDLLEYRDSQI